MLNTLAAMISDVPLVAISSSLVPVLSRGLVSVNLLFLIIVLSLNIKLSTIEEQALGSYNT